MRTPLLLSLVACFCLNACADHVGDSLVVADSPKPPVNQPDTGAIDSGANTGNSGSIPVPGGNGGSASANEGGGQAGSGGSAGAGAGGNGAGGNGAGGSGASGEGSVPPAQVDGGGGQGGQGGQPVPEPSTLLLVGTGLAGAALLRRRRERKTPS